MDTHNLNGTKTNHKLGRTSSNLFVLILELFSVYIKLKEICLKDHLK